MEVRRKGIAFLCLFFVSFPLPFLRFSFVALLGRRPRGCLHAVCLEGEAALAPSTPPPTRGWKWAGKPSPSKITRSLDPRSYRGFWPHVCNLSNIRNGSLAGSVS